MDKAHARDMLAIKNAISSFFATEELFNGEFENGKLIFECSEGENDGKFDSLLQIRDLLEKGISDEPSVLLNEGNLIKDGYNEELDGLRSMRDNSRQILEQYLEEEKHETGISSLKIRYNRLIGYFFEVKKNSLDKVPKHFIRRQGMADGERYTTAHLADLESEINGASDRVVELEKKLFLEIREETKKSLALLSASGRRLAEIDVAESLAKAASVRGWTRPELNESGNLEIYEGRHPVVEAHLGRGEYIPNDILLNTSSTGISFAMITGPNMAGKSTYLRSSALITIMAQAGSFVPASQARIGLCDRIYCRVGASDNLARGESTFLVEMNETAFILNTATEKSLVIMDEVGRGTGTNDGLSIAWAVSEELLNRVGCRTLFATHFHELSLLSHPRLANYSMEVLEQGEKIVFLRKLKEGPTAESYGLFAAMLAGLSRNVIERAGQIMKLLKQRDSDLSDTFGENIVNQDKNKVNVEKINEHDRFEKLLQGVDTDKMTPLEALSTLCQWKKIQKSGISSFPEKQSKPRQSNSNEDTSPSLFD
jgi:DNA mismatch repair protein MutS